MHPVSEALEAYVDAANHYTDVATTELREQVLARFPTAVRAEVTGISTEDYSEHTIEVYDEEGNRLDGQNDWPEDPLGYDWMLEVTEGICLFSDQETVLLGETP